MKKPEIKTTNGSIRITQSWFSVPYLILLILVVIAIVIIARTGYASRFAAGVSLLMTDPALFNEGMKEMGPLKVFESGMIYFSLFILLFFIYYALCRMVNRTVIRGDSISISASHGPLPWPLTRRAKAEIAAVKKFSVEKRVEKTSRSAIPFYRVTAEGGKRIPLSAYLEDDAPAKEICRKLNDFYSLR